MNRILFFYPLQKSFALILLMPLLAISLFLAETNIALFLVGALLGASLNYFQFGFRTCSHQLLTQGRTLGIRAVLWMLALSTVLFFGLLTLGSINGQTMVGFVQPLSLSVVAGAFMFGIGMQLANGCTSGTFNKLGQLQPLSLSSFIFLLIGGTLAAYHIEFWRSVPALAPVSVLEQFGLISGLIIQLGLIALLYWLAIIKEKNHFTEVSQLTHTRFWKIKDWHPWLKAGLFLASLNALLLLLSGQPWSIANVFPYWGLKVSDGLNLPLDWQFWSYGISHANRLDSTILQDTVSLTTLGLIFGALLVTLLAKNTQQEATQFTLKPHLFAVVGGFIMGYGSVIAFGCNIGAFFSGIGSGSLHGWLWAIAALAGNSAGIYLKNRLVKH